MVEVEELKDPALKAVRVWNRFGRDDDHGPGKIISVPIVPATPGPPASYILMARIQELEAQLAGALRELDEIRQMHTDDVV